MKARLKDVAAKAGVAPNTASTILNRRPNSWASKETEERVFKAAEELGYRPSRAALGLRLGSFRTIGLLIPDLHNPIYTTFADHLESRLREMDYDLILEHSRTDLEYEKHCLDSLLDRQIDAVSYFVSDRKNQASFLEKAKAAGKEVVVLTEALEKPLPYDTIEMDFSSGINAAIEHLLGLGHRRFVFLCALAKGQEPGERPGAYRRLLSERGIPQEDCSFISCAHELSSAREAFGEFLDANKQNRPTALIAMNDLSAFGAMRASWDRGLEVPGDLSVIGVDDIPLGDCLHRRLTTIGQPLKEMAEKTAEMLLSRLEAKSMPPKPRSVRFQAELLLKETTASPPSK